MLSQSLLPPQTIFATEVLPSSLHITTIAESIYARSGLLQPLLVRRTHANRFMLLDNRQLPLLAAAQLARELHPVQCAYINVMVLESDIDTDLYTM